MSNVSIGKVKGKFDLIPVIVLLVPIVLGAIFGGFIALLSGAVVNIAVFAAIGLVVAVLAWVAYSKSVIEQDA